MNNAPDFRLLCEEIKVLSGLTKQDEATLGDLGALILPSLGGVSERTVATLRTVPSAAALVEQGAGVIRKAHQSWLASLFTRSMDADYAKWLYQIGAAHARLKLPAEFMAAGMSLALRELLLVAWAAALDAEMKTRACTAIGSACTFSQLIMQRSYGDDLSLRAAEKAAMITEVSSTLFERLAAVYQVRSDPVRPLVNQLGANARPRRRGRYAIRSQSSSRCSRRAPGSYS